jgi:hypothetical protein
MRYRSVAGETRLDKLLATRVGDLGTYVRRLFRLNRVPRHKYDVELPDSFDSATIERIVYSIRGEDYQPALFILGVHPRSGTNYLADLFSFHEDIYPHPRKFWEFPLLSVTNHVMQLQNDFARVYRRNAEVLRPMEFAAYLSAGFMRSLQQQVGPGKTMLFKFPYAHYVDLFRTIFPKDYLVLILRDGRDVVTSSLKTFRKGILRRGFSDYCREWNYATRAILKYDAHGCAVHPRTVVVKYESLFQNPEERMREILQKFGLSADRYDFKNLREMAVRGSSDLVERGGAAHWKPVKRTSTFNPVGRWKGWSEGQKRRFKAIAGETLIAAGYEAGENW